MALAHKDESIYEHGTDVAERMEETTKAIDSDVAQVVGLLHDFGKYCSVFQKYIKQSIDENNSVNLSPKEKRRKRHSFVGGVATAATLDKLGFSGRQQFVGFYIVAKHHSNPGDIGNLSEYTNFSDQKVENRAERVKWQIEDIKNNATQEANSLLDETDGDVTVEDVYQYYMNEFYSMVRRYEPTRETYKQILTTWSGLTSADKKETVGVPEISTEPLNPEAVEKHISEFEEKEEGILKQLNEKRENSRREAVSNVDKLKKNKFGKITLPTGFGKTLTGLQVGLKNSQERDGPLIYALPYTTIIDQTDSVIKDVFKSLSETDPEYTLHHYLADTRSIPQSYTDSDIQNMMAKTWDGELILTTFVQLFESLAGPTNKQSLKLPNLEDATIILDEPQALPHDWWLLSNRLMEILQNKYNAHIILMTATQPKIGQKYPYTDNPKNLTEKTSKQAFNFLDKNQRVSFNYHKSLENYLENPSEEGLSLKEASKQVKTQECSTLAICNTKKSVIEISKNIDDNNILNLNKELKNKYKEGELQPSLISSTNINKEENKEKTQSQFPSINENAKSLAEIAKNNSKKPLITLTTRLRPIDRKILIKTIEKLADRNESFITISTQLVEAGVDVSFEKVYRDYAPLSSIIQAAGRCNREFGDKEGNVIIWRLKGDETISKTPSQLIYGNTPNLLNPTRETLREYTSPLSEYQMIHEAINKYYEKLHKKEKPGSEELAAAIDNANFKKLSNESLINQYGETVDIIIPTAENEIQLLDAYRTIRDMHFKDREEKYKRLNNIRQVLQHRSVSVIVEDTKDLSLEKLDDRLFVINAKNNPKQYRIANAVGPKEPEIEDRFLG